MRNQGEAAEFGSHHVESGELGENAEDPGDEDAEEDGAADVLVEKPRSDDCSDDGQDGADATLVEGLAPK